MSGTSDGGLSHSFLCVCNSLTGRTTHGGPPPRIQSCSVPNARGIKVPPAQKSAHAAAKRVSADPAGVYSASFRQNAWNLGAICAATQHPPICRIAADKDDGSGQCQGQSPTPWHWPLPPVAPSQLFKLAHLKYPKRQTSGSGPHSRTRKLLLPGMRPPSREFRGRRSCTGIAPTHCPFVARREKRFKKRFSSRRDGADPTRNCRPDPLRQAPRRSAARPRQWHRAGGCPC